MIWYLFTAIFTTFGILFVIQETIRCLLLADHRPTGLWIEMLQGDEREVVHTLSLLRLNIRLEDCSFATKLVLVEDGLSESARTAARAYCLAHQMPQPCTLQQLRTQLDIACKREGSAVQ